MQQHDRQILHSSMESNWRTPRPCYERLDREFNFYWDLAADRDSSCCGEHFFGPGSKYGEDALAIDWNDDRLHVLRGNRHLPRFLNPPFSKTLMNAYRTGRIRAGREWVEHPVDEQKAKSYDISEWAKKCWTESQKGATVVGIFPFAPQTDWYRQYVYGHTPEGGWAGHAAMQERRLPHRISFLQPDGSPAGNAGVNSVIVVWQPNCGIVGPWTPWTCYWSYRGGE